MTPNEAAERLRREFRDVDTRTFVVLLDEALAAERRATVERIREAVLQDEPWGLDVRLRIEAILDEEAAR